MTSPCDHRATQQDRDWGDEDVVYVRNQAGLRNICPGAGSKKGGGSLLLDVVLGSGQAAHGDEPAEPGQSQVCYV